MTTIRGRTKIRSSQKKSTMTSCRLLFGSVASDPNKINNGNQHNGRDSGSDGYHRSNRPNKDVLDVTHIFPLMSSSPSHSATNDVMTSNKVPLSSDVPAPGTDVGGSITHWYPPAAVAARKRRRRSRMEGSTGSTNSGSLGGDSSRSSQPLGVVPQRRYFYHVRRCRQRRC